VFGCRFIIVACDGLWKIFDNDTAVAFIDKILKVLMSVCAVYISCNNSNNNNNNNYDNVYGAVIMT